jgi:hypothetical protein
MSFRIGTIVSSRNGVGLSGSFHCHVLHAGIRPMLSIEFASFMVKPSQSGCEISEKTGKFPKKT